MRVAALVALGCGAGFVGLLWRAGPSDAVLSEYATSLEGRTLDQKRNAELAMLRLSGKVIQPGEVFSFNTVVGSWSRDRGYRKAPVSFNGQLISSWGGGVCQTSTTLYNCALLAGLEVIERHPHHIAPTYVPPGRDAAVAFSGVDLRFRNTYDKPLTIRGEIINRRLVLRIVGSGIDVPRVQLSLNVRQVLRPMSYSIGQPASQARLRNSGKPGYDVELYRTMKGSRRLVSADSYPAVNRIVEYRPSSAPASSPPMGP